MSKKYKDLESLKIASVVENYPALKVYKAWKSCAGPIFSKCIRFQGLFSNNGILAARVSINDPLWKQEFQYQKDTLLQRFQNELKKIGVSNRDIPQELIVGFPKK